MAKYTVEKVNYNVFEAKIEEGTSFASGVGQTPELANVALIECLFVSHVRLGKEVEELKARTVHPVQAFEPAAMLNGEQLYRKLDAAEDDDFPF